MIYDYLIIKKIRFMDSKSVSESPTSHPLSVRDDLTIHSHSIDYYLNEIKDSEKTNSVTEKKEIYSDIVFCNECKIPGIIYETNIWECEKCGQILDSLPEHLPEWRYYSGDTKSDPTRCSVAVNTLLPQSSKSTIMLSGPCSYNSRRTQRMHSWEAMPYNERCLNNIFQLISLRSSNGCILNNVTKLAQEYYAKISVLHVSRGEIRKGLIAACIYMACKKLGVPRTTQEIADMFKVTERCVTRGNKKFTELWILSGEKPIEYVANSQASEYIVRFCSKLDVNPKFLKTAKKITEICKKHDLLSQNTPVSIAAAAVFMAIQLLKINISRSKVSSITNTSEVTIAKCIKELSKNLDLLQKELQ